jgi:apolipoprotein N-acyltransferase
MTAILNEKGRVLAQAPMFRETVLRGTAQGMTGSTPFVRWGNGAFLVLVVLALAVALILFSRSAKIQ